MLTQRLRQMWAASNRRQTADHAIVFEPNEGVATGGERLESVALAIAEVAAELEAATNLHARLAQVSGDVREEFRARVKENARIASLEVELANAKTALAALEVEAARAKTELKSSTQESVKLAARLEEAGAKLENAEREVIEQRQAVAQHKLNHGKLEEELRKGADACSDVSIALRGAQDELERRSRAAGDLAAAVKTMKDEAAAAADQQAALTKHLEESRNEAIRATREIENLKHALDGALDRANELETKLAAADATAARLVQEKQAQAALTKIRNSEIQLKLDETAARIARLETNRNASLDELGGANTERTQLRALLSAKEVEVGQLGAKLAALETTLEGQRIKAADTEAARSASVLRAEHLNKDLIAAQARLSRAETALEQHAAEAKAAAESDEAAKGVLLQKNRELQSLVAQQKAEIAMLRGAVDAVKKARPILAAE